MNMMMGRVFRAELRDEIRSIVREPTSLFFGVLMLILLYFVGAEQGATSLLSGEEVHEWVHDARHLLGFPCH